MWQNMRLEAKGLSCVRGGRLIFKDLNFVVASGAMLELRGPNGSGKSSLLRLIAGLNAPEAGNLKLDPFHETVAEACHYVGHSEALKPSLTVQQNLDFWQRFLGGNGGAALSAFHLSKLCDDPAGLLSEGQRRRLALSRLVAVQRPIWLLDEPSVGLDASALEDLNSLMQGHLKNAGIIIAATHAELGLGKAQILNFEGRS
jgi:heme exporter protein A